MFTRSLGGVLGATIAGLVINLAAGAASISHEPKAFGAAIAVSFAINAAVMCVASSSSRRCRRPQIAYQPVGIARLIKYRRAMPLK